MSSDVGYKLEVVRILDRKDAGQDCTQDESATIKGYVKHGTDAELVARIERTFPLEWDESLDELKRGLV